MVELMTAQPLFATLFGTNDVIINRMINTCGPLPDFMEAKMKERFPTSERMYNELHC
jgi:hypothetical protein